MFEARQVNAHIKTILRGATPGLAAELQQDLQSYTPQSRLAATYQQAEHYAQLGMPSITAAYLSLAPRKAWRYKAATLSEAYRARANKTLEHLQEAQEVNNKTKTLKVRSSDDLARSDKLIALSQRGRRTRPQQVQIA